MAFKVYFLKTFPSQAQISELFKLFSRLAWEIEFVKFENKDPKDFLGVAEDIVLVSPEFSEVSIFFNGGYLNIYLPISTAGWEKVEEFIERRVKVCKTYPETAATVIEEIEAQRVFINEKEAVFVEPERELSPFYTCKGEELEEVVGSLLREKKLTIATAESCTGGLVAATLVNVPGSSEYFKGSVVAYSNEVKEKVLGVKKETLEKYGAVSPQTAEEMALGVKRLLGTDIGVSTTGIAGPGGGTPEKPVGLTYFAIAYGDRVETYKKVFSYSRNQNRLSATYYILFRLYRLIKGDG